jgi:hypothetical protein
MTKKEQKYKKYRLLPPKIAESVTVSLGYSLCGSDESIYTFTVLRSYKTNSLLAFKMIDPATGWFEIVEATNKSATSTQDFFLNT